MLSICGVLQLHLTAAALACIALVTLAFVDLRALLILTYPVVSLIGVVASVAVIEAGTYVGEQRRYGFNAGATPWLALYAVGFLLVAHVIISFAIARLRTTRDVPSRGIDTTLLAFIIVATLLYSVIFTFYGTGLGYAARFDWFNSLPPAVEQLNNLIRSFGLPVFYALFGFTVAYFRNFRPWYFLAFLPLIAIALTGEKFSSFVYSISMALAGIGIAAAIRGERIKIKSAHILMGSAAAVALAALVVEGYRRMGSENVVDALAYRISLQGHVWWGIAERFDGRAVVDLADILGETSLDSPAGLDFLSYLVSPPDFVYPRLATGIPFTMGGPPGILASLGLPVGLLVFSLLGALYAVVALLAIWSLSAGDPIGAVASFVLYVAVGLATQMGYWDALYGTLTGVALGMLAICAVWRRASRPRLVRV